MRFFSCPEHSKSDDSKNTKRFHRVGPYILLALLLGERFLHIDVFGVWITSIMNVVVQGFSAIARILGH